MSSRADCTTTSTNTFSTKLCAWTRMRWRQECNRRRKSSLYSGRFAYLSHWRGGVCREFSCTQRWRFSSSKRRHLGGAIRWIPKRLHEFFSTQQQRYSLRNRDVLVRPIQKKKYVEAPKNDTAGTQRKGKEVVEMKSSKSTSAEPPHQQVASKERERKEILVKEV